MNKVLILGHPASGWQEVESLLRDCGMQPPLVSRRDGLSPQDIAQALVRAHDLAPVAQAMEESDLSPIEVGAVWHGMALDLLLGNLGQPFWGWSDPEAIYLLEYWRSLDPSIVFVLVYDHPRSALKALSETEAVDDLEQNTPRALDNWMAYNGALLSFYLRHPERCVLASVDQVRLAADPYLAQLSSKLHRPLQPVPMPAQSHGVPALQSAGRAAHAGPADSLERYLIDGILQRHPQSLQLLEELQSAASVAPLGPRAPAPDPMQAWLALSQHRAMVAEAMAHATALCERAEQKLHQLETEATLRLESSAAERLALLHERGEALAHAAAVSREKQLLEGQLDTVNAEFDQEREQLQSQLHQLREHLDSQSQQTETLRAESDARVQALNTENARLESQRETSQQAFTQQHRQVSSQLHQLQAELERQFLESQNLKRAVLEAAQPRLLGAAERIRQQLTYRLGARAIRQSTTLWGRVLLLPGLWAETRAFRQDQKARAEQKLLPIAQYADREEAEHTRQHPAYQLGQRLLQKGRHPLKWLWLPFSVRAEVKALTELRTEGN